MKRVAERVAKYRVGGATAGFRSIYPLAIGLVIAWFLQQILAPVIGPFPAKMVLDIGIAIVLASSLNIVNGFGGQFSIGHAGFMMVGGYAAAWLTYYGSIQLWGSAEIHGDFLGAGDWLFLGACVLGGVLAAVAGLVVGLPSLRLRGDYLAIVTLGFGEIVRVLAQRSGDVLYPDDAKAEGLAGTVTNLGGSLGFGGLPTYTRIFYVYMFVAIVLIAAYRLKTSSKGRQLLAVRENEIAAEAMGVNTARVKVSSFVMAAFFAGIGGALFAHELGTTLNPRELGFQKSIDLVIMVVLGGMGSISGVVLAAIGLTIMPELFRSFSDYRMPIYALALIIVMIVRPQGLFGIKELWDLPWWRRYVIPAWRKIASGWLIPEHEAQLPSAVAREASSERAGGNLAKPTDDTDPSKPEDKS
ncbi:MAG: inner-rane translocator [Myxococcales bacterium]|nr:inner-rane translocator [Myxococcales bacterium]